MPFQYEKPPLKSSRKRPAHARKAERRQGGGVTVLVTGAAGFIGSFVCERLLAAGGDVVGLDSLDDYYDPSIKRRNLAAASAHPRFRLVEGDFRDRELLERLFAEVRPRAVIHLGARAGVRRSITQPALYADVNLVGTSLVLDASRRHGVESFIFASSSSVYGERPAKPFREDDEVDRPVSPYAATKRGGELLAYTCHHLYGLPVTCLRFFTVYGPRQRPEMAVHAFTRAIAQGEPIEIFGDGSARRDFTYIDDIVDGVMAALERCAGFRVYNLGRGDAVEIGEVIALIERALAAKARIRYRPAEPGDVPVTLADVTRARVELGYRPRVSIAEGVERFIAWFRAQ
jgi:UDP-glucuronate 4-epimerase